MPPGKCGIAAARAYDDCNAAVPRWWIRQSYSPLVPTSADEWVLFSTSFFLSPSVSATRTTPAVAVAHEHPGGKGHPLSTLHSPVCLPRGDDLQQGFTSSLRKREASSHSEIDKTCLVACVTARLMQGYAGLFHVPRRSAKCGGQCDVPHLIIINSTSATSSPPSGVAWPHAAVMIDNAGRYLSRTRMGATNNLASYDQPRDPRA